MPLSERWSVAFKISHIRGIFRFIYSQEGDPLAELQSPDVAACAGWERHKDSVLTRFWLGTCPQLANPNVRHTLFTLPWQASQLLSALRREIKDGRVPDCLGTPSACLELGEQISATAESTWAQCRDLAKINRAGSSSGRLPCDQPLEGCRKSEHFTGPGRNASLFNCALLWWLWVVLTAMGRGHGTGSGVLNSQRGCLWAWDVFHPTSGLEHHRPMDVKHLAESCDVFISVTIATDTIAVTAITITIIIPITILLPLLIWVIGQGQILTAPTLRFAIFVKSLFFCFLICKAK